MNETVMAGTNSVLEALRLQGWSDTVTVVLIGSAARDMMNERSDIDMLVLGDLEHPIRLNSPVDVHLQQCGRSKFLARLGEGDDYPAWALRFGIPVKDPDGWWAKQVTAERENPHWPNWRPKVNHAQKRWRMALELLADGDIEAASEEMMLSAAHIARASLLKRGVFPLSRPELPTQLRTFDTTLAQHLKSLIDDPACYTDLESLASLLESRIEELDQAPEEDSPVLDLTSQA